MSLLSTFSLGAFACGLALASAANAEPLKVVASFSILGDLVTEVGGQHVDVHTIVGPNGDAHVYQPTPADARETAAADLVVVNGLGFEGWLDRLTEASGFSGAVLVASTGVTPLNFAEEAAAGMPVEEEEDGEAQADHAQEADAPAGSEEASGHPDHETADAAHEAEHHHGALDPHAWQSIPNAQLYVENIADGLCRADEANCPDYRANAAAYTDELRAIDAGARSAFAAIPEEQRKVITTHDAFGYFAKEYGLTFIAPQGVSTDSEASAADVAALITQIREQHIQALFLENISDPRLIEQIGAEAGVAPGGELFSDALSTPDGPAPTYVAMMKRNIALLAGAMRGS